MNRKLVSALMISVLISVSFGYGFTFNAGASSFVEELPNIPWGAGFTPRDVEWNDAGTVCVVVGEYSVDNAFVYWSANDTWIPLDTQQNILKDVVYDNVNDYFWMCGDDSGSPASTVLYFAAGAEPPYIDYPGSEGGIPITLPLNAIACDHIGNPLVAGSGLDYLYYFNASDGTNSWSEILDWDGELFDVNLHSISFNPNDQRFYLVGDKSGVGEIYYTTTAPLSSSEYTYHDYTEYAFGQPPFSSISWNDNQDYGLVTGLGKVYKTWGLDPVLKEMLWEIVHENLDDVYYQAKWDESAWEEAAIVGSNGSQAAYWRYYDYSERTVLAHTDSGETEFMCVDVKPPASPKWVIIPYPNGALKVNIMSQDQSSTISVNAAYPQMHWIGFNDSGMVNKMDKQVNVEDWYWITLGANYSQGWNNIDVYVEAWYDNGLTGGGGSTFPTTNDRNRTLAFTLVYDVGVGSYNLIYPGNEVQIGAFNDIVVPSTAPAGEEHHRVELGVYFGKQVRAADGTGFAGAGPDYHYDPDIALDDPDSWDFSVTIRDGAAPTASNTSYGEFGLFRYTNITVTGDPGGNAPPGIDNYSMGANSQITYSTNTDYYVNVSIDNLNRIGGGGSIPASNVKVLINSPLANNTNTQINGSWGPAGRAFPGANQTLGIWGNTSQPAWAIDAPRNGTTAHGPWGSDFNGYGATIVEWYVTVPAATAEGVYRSKITFTIGYY
ncbi:MAG: hypothetical protein KAS67_01235 [Thermoplasmata archaeon]|nr:hypothetical protein [Thermoplasmata archaeon]